MSSPDFQVEQEKRCVYIWRSEKEGAEKERGRRNEKAIVIKR